MPKKVCLISPLSWTGVSNPFQNTFRVCREKGQDVFIIADFENSKMNRIEGVDGVEILRYEKNLPYKVLFRLSPKLAFIYDSLRWNRKYGEILKKCNVLIGFQPLGMYRIALSPINDVKKYFFSLEIDRKNDYSGIDRYLIGKMDRCFTQDRFRARILNLLYGVKGKFESVYNSPIGTINKTKSDLFRTKFTIPQTKTLILLSGTLCDEHWSLEFLKAYLALPIPHSYALIVHGWFNNKSFERQFRGLVEQSDSVYFSNEFFKWNEKNILYESVDIGLVGFSSDTLNHRYAAWSSGKLFDFMQHGVPILAKNSIGMRELVEQNQIGKVLDNTKQFIESLDIITGQYNQYRDNCFRTFPNFEFRKNFNLITD